MGTESSDTGQGSKDTVAFFTRAGDMYRISMCSTFSKVPLTHFFFFLVSAFLPVAARTGHVAAVTSAMTHLRVVIARCTEHASDAAYCCSRTLACARAAASYG